MSNYTLKDYETIFDFLTEKAVELSNGQWTDFTDGDFGTVIIHLLSYWGDLLSNQADLTASELFMDTAEERTSLMEIVKLIGYEPSSYQSSMASVYVSYIPTPNSQYSPDILPAFSKFLSNSNLSYYTLYPVKLSSDTTVVPAYEGTRVNLTFYYRDIAVDGRITINDPNLATNAVLMTIVSGPISGDISRVQDVRFTSGELCFSVHTDLDGYPYLQFPLWWSSLITDPVTISVTYLRTSGQDGRVGANTITRLTDNSQITGKYSVNNPEASIGGTNPETVMEIKAKASVWARTMYTAVTLKDFEDISIFTDDIAQVRALDYNHDDREFPPTISPYQWPTPPNGIPNDAYKVLIMAVPNSVDTQTIFTGETIEYYDEDDNLQLRPNYGSLTREMQTLHNIYMDRKSATLYMEYRDPVYINPWLIMNIYLKNPNDLRSNEVAGSVNDYLRTRFGRNRVQIGQSIYGAVVGREVLTSFPYINYIEIRDPEYNIEALPYEFIDVYNGHFMSWVDDELMLVPKGLNLLKIKQGEEVMLNVGTEEEGHTTSIMWVSQNTYESDPTYIPNSYLYEWSKSEGKYPRPELNQLGLFWDGLDNKVMTLMIPDSMYDLGAAQYVSIYSGRILHIFSKLYGISEIAEYTDGQEPVNPSFATYEIIDEGTPEARMKLKFTPIYSSVEVTPYSIASGEQIKITYPDGTIYVYDNDGQAPVEVEDIVQDIYYTELSGNPTFYVPTTWIVEISTL